MILHKIVFREFTLTDLHLLKTVFQNPEIMAYTLDDCFSDEELDQFHKNILKNNISSPRNIYEYAVFQDDNFIGFADFTIFQKNRSGGVAEIGYLIQPQYWGRGFGSTIAKELIEICFSQHHLHRVYAKCNSNNIGSKRVLEKNGMKLEGELRKQRYKNGQWVDEHVYALLNPNLPGI